MAGYEAIGQIVARVGGILALCFIEPIAVELGLGYVLVATHGMFRRGSSFEHGDLRTLPVILGRLNFTGPKNGRLLATNLLLPIFGAAATNNCMKYQQTREVNISKQDGMVYGLFRSSQKEYLSTIHEFLGSHGGRDSLRNSLQ